MSKEGFECRTLETEGGATLQVFLPHKLTEQQKIEAMDEMMVALYEAMTDKIKNKPGIKENENGSK